MTGMYDVHCHILPNVDDGAETMEIAIQLLRKEYQDGVRSIILTPHYRRGMFETPMETILDRYEKLKQAASDIDIRLFLGCEYHVNMNITESLRTGKRPTLGGTPYVLCEFSSASDPAFIKERCYSLIVNGYVPVLAHIERYSSLTEDFDLIEELTELGCMMQVNAGSILGADGFRTRRFCRKLIDYNMLHLIGSDAHDLKKRRPRVGECAEYLVKKAGSNYAERILCENPSRIFE